MEAKKNPVEENQQGQKGNDEGNHTGTKDSAGGPMKMNLALTNFSASDFQLNLFVWCETHVKVVQTKSKKTKTVNCLDCDRVELTMKFNDKTNRYEGRRICKGCRALQKRKYLAW